MIDVTFRTAVKVGLGFYLGVIIALHVNALTLKAVEFLVNTYLPRN